MSTIQPYVALADLLSFELGLNKQPKSLRSLERRDLIVRSDVRHRLFSCQNGGSHRRSAGPPIGL